MDEIIELMIEIVGEALTDLFQHRVSWRCVLVSLAVALAVAALCGGMYMLLALILSL